MDVKHTDSIADRYVKVGFTDIDGILRGKLISKEKYEKAKASGMGFCDVVFGWDLHDDLVEGQTLTGWHSGFPDKILAPDNTTVRALSFEGDLPFLFADFSKYEKNAVDFCPRSILKQIINSTSDSGIRAKVGFEYEWYNLKKEQKEEYLSSGMFGYSIQRLGEGSDFFQAIIHHADKSGCRVEGFHTETGPGVVEAALESADPLAAADAAVLFKYLVKIVGGRHGVLPTFMAKCSPNLPGSGCHIHQSIFREDGASLGELSENGLPQKLENYLAGLVQLLPDLCVLLAPTVNSYKRLHHGDWAPSKISWGWDNRTTALRIIGDSKETIRIENRVPAPDINPYLALSACLAAGFYGIEEKLTLNHKPIKGSAYEQDSATRLPEQLDKAAERFYNNDIISDLFGKAFVEHYYNTRMKEWKKYHSYVSDWEVDRYREIL